METLPEQITYRLYEEKDVPAILRLWEEESGWGGITEEQFNTWYIDTPYGKSLIVVAENTEGKIIGQLVFSPSRMMIDGKEIRSLRGSAPIINKEMRGDNMRDYNHPAFAMIRVGFELAYEAGYQYVYTFPAYGWLGLFRMFPRIMPNPNETASFDCFSISLTDEKTLAGNDDDFNISLQTTFGEEYDQLWEEAVLQMPVNCSIVRRQEWLKWVIGGMHVLEVRAVVGNKLIGYAAIKKDSGLLTDIFARNVEDLEKVYRQLVYGLHHMNQKRIPVGYTNIKGMLTGDNQPILKNIGYSIEEFRFAFGGYLLDTTIPFEKVQVNRWYITPLG
jgi:hypothetical protein